ncbi:MAG: DUF1800 domain-containing protein [Planctomycetota bacterium]
MQELLFTWFAALTLSASAFGQAPPTSPVSGPEPPWDRGAVEHLLNRAGFGARPATIERWVAAGRAALLDELFRPAAEQVEPFYVRLRGSAEMVGRMRDMAPEDRRQHAVKLRREDVSQLRDYTAWWLERLADDDAGLVERMTLFWHGYFPSSYEDVKNGHELIVQNQLFREFALGDFDELLRRVARDPAMLEYLDNDANRRGNPNENFAREVMELFTLGEGNYTETDVKEAARAFTGWTDRFGEFAAVRRRHDRGFKTVLGRTGRLDGDDVIDALLAHPACAPWVASRLLEYFEGVAPDDERLERYAAVLLEVEWNVGRFLRRLFEDPAFYRDEIRSARIASPLDYLVGSARRLGVSVPPGLTGVGAAALGERLFFPPNVKGWEGGTRWITTSTLMLRGNLIGVITGSLTIDDLIQLPADELEHVQALRDEALDAMDGEALEAMELMEPMDASTGTPRRAFAGSELAALRRVQRSGWRPRLNLTARLRLAEARTDAAIVERLADELLAVELEASTEYELVAHLAEQRHALGVADGALLDDPQASEPLLRRLAHLLLSSPEAQLH